MEGGSAVQLHYFHLVESGEGCYLDVWAASWYFFQIHADPLQAASEALHWVSFLSHAESPTLVRNWMRDLPMEPRLPTSNGHKITLQPFCVYSKTRSAYLSLLYSLATSMLSSQGTVCSPIITAFAFLDHITRPGLRSVRAISCGNISWVSRSVSTTSHLLQREFLSQALPLIPTQDPFL